MNNLFANLQRTPTTEFDVVSIKAAIGMAAQKMPPLWCRVTKLDVNLEEIEVWEQIQDLPPLNQIFKDISASPTLLTDGLYYTMAGYGPDSDEWAFTPDYLQAVLQTGEFVDQVGDLYHIKVNSVGAIQCVLQD